MRHMAGDGQLVNVKGTYSLPTLASSSGNSSEVSIGGEVGDVGNLGNSGSSSNSAEVDGPEEVTELPQLPVLHG
jgi:hypothetical protein